MKHNQLVVVIVAIVVVAIIILAPIIRPNTPSPVSVSLPLASFPSPADLVRWSVDGHKLAIGHSNGILSIWTAPKSEDSDSQKLVDIGTPIDKNITAISWSPSGDKLAVGFVNGSVNVFDSESTNTISALLGFQRSIESLAWSPDNQEIAGSSFCDSVIWDVQNSHILSSLHDMCWLNWTGVLNGLIGATPNGSVHIWNTKTDQSKDIQADSITVSPDGQKFVTSSGVWDISTGQQITEPCGDCWGATIESVAWSPDSSKIATGSGNYLCNVAELSKQNCVRDYDIRVWDASSGKLLMKLKGHEAPVVSLAWNFDGSQLTSAGFQDKIIVWDIKTRQLMKEVQIPDIGDAGHVSINPSGNMVALIDGNGKVNIWNLANMPAVTPSG